MSGLMILFAFSMSLVINLFQKKVNPFNETEQPTNQKRVERRA